MLEIYRKTWSLLDNKKIRDSLIIIIIIALTLTQIYFILSQKREITLGLVIIKTILSFIPGSFVSFILLFFKSKNNSISYTQNRSFNYHNFIKIFIIYNLIMIPLSILLSELGYLN